MPPEEQPPEEQSFFGEERRSEIPSKRSFLSSVKKFFSQLNTPRRQSFKRSDGLTRRHGMPLRGSSLEAEKKKYKKRGALEQVLLGPRLEKKKDEKTPRKDVPLFGERKLIKRSEFRQWMKKSELYKVDRLSGFARDKKFGEIFPKMRKGYLRRKTVKLKLKELRTQRYKDQTLKGRKEIDKTMRVLERALGDKKY